MNIEERRRFQRVPFIADVIVCDKEQQWNCILEDVSLKGLLIVQPEAATQPLPERIYDVTLVLGKEATIKMRAKISHTNDGRWGMQWVDIDIECFTHLRRLLELNTQDPEVVHRELSDLKNSVH